MTSTNVERAVLRAAVGRDNYVVVERLASLIDELVARGVIDDEARTRVVRALGEEIIVAAVMRDASLQAARDGADTPPLEAPP